VIQAAGVRPVSRQGLVAELVERILATKSEQWLRVAVDGAPPAQPDQLADALAEPVRAGGRPVVRVRAADYLRPASLRLEYGRHDPDAFYDDWLDTSALRREVLSRLEPGGSGLVRATHWDSVTDRASREPSVELPARGVAIVSGGLLLGRGLDFDLTVHIELTTAALARRLDPELAWTLPAYQRHARVAPGECDILVRADDPRHPAIVTAASARTTRATRPSSPGARGIERGRPS
jgi:hypothetical protein